MPKLEIEYKCLNCGKPPPAGYLGMVCLSCCGPIRGSGPSVTGTRDNFGIGKEFRDDETGETIDNWRTWEKRGFQKAPDAHKGDMKEKIKEKIEKQNHKNQQ